MGVRHAVYGLVANVNDAISSGMLGTVGFAALVMLLKRRALAVAAAIVCFTPVAVNGMFNPGYPMLALALGSGIIVIFVFAIVRGGLLPAMAALATHFILLRAPLSTNLWVWWAPAGWWYLGAVAVLGFGACYVARSTQALKPARQYSLQNA